MNGTVRSNWVNSPVFLNSYDKIQDRRQKIVSFEDKVHGAFNMRVIKLLQSLY